MSSDNSNNTNENSNTNDNNTNNNFSQLATKLVNLLDPNAKCEDSIDFLTALGKKVDPENKLAEALNDLETKVDKEIERQKNQSEDGLQRYINLFKLILQKDSESKETTETTEKTDTDSSVKEETQNNLQRYMNVFELFPVKLNSINTEIKTEPEDTVKEETQEKVEDKSSKEQSTLSKILESFMNAPLVGVTCTTEMPSSENTNQQSQECYAAFVKLLNPSNTGESIDTTETIIESINKIKEQLTGKAASTGKTETIIESINKFNEQITGKAVSTGKTQHQPEVNTEASQNDSPIADMERIFNELILIQDKLYEIQTDISFLKTRI